MSVRTCTTRCTTLLPNITFKPTTRNSSETLRSNSLRRTSNPFHPMLQLTALRHFTNHTHRHNDTKTRRHTLVHWWTAVLLTCTGLTLYYTASSIHASSPSTAAPGDAKRRWPEYTLEEIAKHRTAETGIWVHYKGGVYDITNFIQLHPGGVDKIMLAAGSSIEPFWNMYQQHSHQTVKDILATLRIGSVKGYNAATAVAVKDAYADEPQRSAAFLVQSAKPFNAEPPLDLLTANPITSNELFFVRNHLPVPKIDAKDYKLIIEGEGVKRVELTLDDLKSKFRKYSVEVTLQCAGNRRSELNRVKTVKGLDWTSGAISNAIWSGARLKDVLSYAGLDERIFEQQQPVKHIQFEGADRDPLADVRYGSSIPVEKAVSAAGECLLAYEMNGVELPRDHGYPVRAIVPGVVGARNVKWLTRIVASPYESSSHWQQNDYKGFSPSVSWDDVDFTSAPAIQELPVQSAICEPNPLKPIIVQNGDELTVKGYAYSGGGRAIVRVDVSNDGGKNWIPAELTTPVIPSKYNQQWQWSHFKAELSIDKQNADQDGNVEIVCKAVDSAYNVQPDTPAPIWNLRGVLANSWHRVKVKVKEKDE